MSFCLVEGEVSQNYIVVSYTGKYLVRVKYNNSENLTLCGGETEFCFLESTSGCSEVSWHYTIGCEGCSQYHSRGSVKRFTLHYLLQWILRCSLLKLLLYASDSMQRISPPSLVSGNLQRGKMKAILVQSSDACTCFCCKTSYILLRHIMFG